MATKRKTKAKKPATKRVSKKSRGDEERLRDQVRVRMYRHGFGECFLLTFPRLGMPFHMLINCGVLMGTPNAPKVMKSVVENIVQETEGRLDVLVITNRHWDKVSGFIQAQEVFEKIEVGQLWLGWTEDPNDRDARRLEQNRSVGQTAAAVEYVRSMPQRVHYWSGGDGPIALSGVAGARVFFLGPPRRRADLGKARSAIKATESITASPFGESYRISYEAARNDPAFSGFFKDTPTEEVEWRQIGKKSLATIPRVRWSSPASVNDSSLVMAIELIGPHSESKVLLFPGNAQVASWFSWHEHRWPADAPPDDPQAITCRKLLERTVLYKVSHYGSHTGTPREFGLEMMNSPHLRAMLVVDRGMAMKKRWHLPSAEVLGALEQKTRGRVIRSDTGSVTAKERPGDVTKSEWDEFQAATQVTDLYVDHFVTIPQLSVAEQQSSVANWAAANDRRIYLVDKKLAGTIKREEEAELREIEQLMDEYLSVTAPTGFGLLAELRDTVERVKGSTR